MKNYIKLTVMAVLLAMSYAGETYGTTSTTRSGYTSDPIKTTTTYGGTNTGYNTGMQMDYMKPYTTNDMYSSQQQYNSYDKMPTNTYGSTNTGYGSQQNSYGMNTGYGSQQNSYGSYNPQQGYTQGTYGMPSSYGSNTNTGYGSMPYTTATATAIPSPSKAADKGTTYSTDQGKKDATTKDDKGKSTEYDHDCCAVCASKQKSNNGNAYAYGQPNNGQTNYANSYDKMPTNTYGSTNTGYGSQQSSYGSNTGYGSQPSSYGQNTGYGSQQNSYGSNTGYGSQQNTYGMNTGYGSQQNTYGMNTGYGSQQNYGMNTGYGSQNTYSTPTTKNTYGSTTTSYTTQQKPTQQYYNTGYSTQQMRY